MNTFFCSHWRPIVFLLALTLVAFPGCGPEFGDVTGTVTCQGKTVASGTVIILGCDMLPYYGIIGEDGAYAVAKVPAGLAKFAVLSPGPDAAKHLRSFLQGKGGPGFEKKLAPPAFRGDPKKWFPLPEKYREFDTSGLTLTVVGGANHFDVPLD